MELFFVIIFSYLLGVWLAALINTARKLRSLNRAGADGAKES